MVCPNRRPRLRLHARRSIQCRLLSAASNGDLRAARDHGARNGARRIPDHKHMSPRFRSSVANRAAQLPSSFARSRASGLVPVALPDDILPLRHLHGVPLSHVLAGRDSLPRKRHWLGSGICGALLTATRANAVLILVPLLWEALAPSTKSEKQKADDWNISASRWWLLLVPLGLAAYSVYLFSRFGDPLAFLHVQAAFYRQGAKYSRGFHHRCSLPGSLRRVFHRIRRHGNRSLWSRIRPASSPELSTLCSRHARSLLEHIHMGIIAALFERRFSLLYCARIGSFGEFRTLLLSASAAMMVLCSLLFVCGYFMT